MRHTKTKQEKEIDRRCVNPSDADERIKVFRELMPQIVKDVLAGKDIK